MLRVTHDPAPRILYCFREEGDTIDLKNLAKRVASGDVKAEELILGGEIASEQDAIELKTKGATVFPGIKAAVEDAKNGLERAHNAYKIFFMDPLILYYEIPITSFRPYQSREYQDSYPVPPPSTLIGMSLSLCGLSMNHRKFFSSCEMCSAVADSNPARSTVLRRMRRLGDSGRDPKQRRPEYQELVTGIRGIVAYRGLPAELAKPMKTVLTTPEKSSATEDCPSVKVLF